MTKAKKTKRDGKRKQNLMGRSDIPFAQRLTMQHNHNIVVNRNHAAKIAMFTTSVALNEVEGVGYKRLVRYSLHFKEVVDEFYEDPIMGMAHAKHRMEQMGMPISGEFYCVTVDGLSRKEQQIHDHALQASQIALICAAIAMNDEFGFGKERQDRINARRAELAKRYNEEGEQFLLDALGKIGFEIVGGEARCYMDANDNIITPKQFRKEAGNV